MNARNTGLLIAFSGLPGTGKTTLAKALATALTQQGRGVTYLRIDTIEAALTSCSLKLSPVEDAGYAAAYAVAGDNLAFGQVVIADSVNPIRITREAWHQVAEAAGAAMLDVMILCSDPALHRQRVEQRHAGGPEMAGHSQPDWADVMARELDAWPQSASLLTIDTATLSTDECVRAVLTTIPA